MIAIKALFCIGVLMVTLIAINVFNEKAKKTNTIANKPAAAAALNDYYYDNLNEPIEEQQQKIQQTENTPVTSSELPAELNETPTPQNWNVVNPTPEVQNLADTKSEDINDIENNADDDDTETKTRSSNFKRFTYKIFNTRSRKLKSKSPPIIVQTQKSLDFVKHIKTNDQRDDDVTLTAEKSDYRPKQPTNKISKNIHIIFDVLPIAATTTTTTTNTAALRRQHADDDESINDVNENNKDNHVVVNNDDDDASSSSGSGNVYTNLNSSNNNNNDDYNNKENEMENRGTTDKNKTTTITHVTLIPSIEIINLTRIETFSLHNVNASHENEKIIRLTNSYYLRLRNLQFENWNVKREYSHFHYMRPNIATNNYEHDTPSAPPLTEFSSSISEIVHFGKIVLTDAKLNAHVFIMIKGIEVLTLNIASVILSGLQSTLIDEQYTLKVLHIQFVETAKKYLDVIIQHIKLMVSNLFDAYYNDKLQTLTIYPGNLRLNKNENSVDFSSSYKSTYRADFLFITNTDSSELQSAMFLDSVRDYFVPTEYFGDCQCYNSAIGTSNPFIYGKICPTSNSSDRENNTNSTTTLENEDDHIKIIDINNKNTVGDIIKDIMYRFAIT